MMGAMVSHLTPKSQMTSPDTYRSLVETKMHCFKRLGERVMARTFERQVAELQVRAALLNRFTQLGTPDTVAVA
jgi:hypothetical protein